jgi:transcriptional regulator with XRE-family HTH domain
MTTFAERLRALRERAGLTQVQLAEAAGVPIGTLRDYEQGRRRTEPAFRVTVKLAKALGVDCTAFADTVADDAPQPSPARTGRPKKKPRE